jgi:hypothetical protein
VRGDARNPEACARLVVDLVGQLHSLVSRHDGELGSRSEGAVGLRPLHPHTLSDSAVVHALSDGVDDAGAVAVRNDARERHPVAHPVAAFFRVPGIDAGDRNPNSDLAVARLRVRHLTDLEHLPRRSARAPANRELLCPGAYTSAEALLTCKY